MNDQKRGCPSLMGRPLCRHECRQWQALLQSRLGAPNAFFNFKNRTWAGCSPSYLQNNALCADLWAQARPSMSQTRCVNLKKSIGGPSHGQVASGVFCQSLAAMHPKKGNKCIGECGGSQNHTNTNIQALRTSVLALLRVPGRLMVRTLE